ncbi:hypothetical protein QUA07_28985, partial [Microcoleus sp. T3_A4]|uniref:hypothetical protein n=1 Tax=Microcoleus sp. T3_A4 TaxID=2818968 RepID=UPI002FD77E9D
LPHLLMRLFALIVQLSVSFLFEITITPVLGLAAFVEMLPFLIFNFVHHSLLQNKTIALLYMTTQLFSVKIRELEGEY